MKKIVFLASITAIVGAGVALAQTGDAGTRVSSPEGRRARFMAEADTDNDGELSKAERQAFHARMRERHFRKKDSNGDGQLTADELPYMPEDVFVELDRDRSGGLSLAELPEPRRFHRHGRFGARMFERIDADGDGKITKEEMRNASDARFARLDSDSDGVVTQDELKAHKKSRRRHRRKPCGR